MRFGMKSSSRYFNSSPEGGRFPLCLRQVDDLLYGRSIQICHETARFRDIRALHKFDTAHASTHSRFNLERHLVQ